MVNSKVHHSVFSKYEKWINIFTNFLLILPKRTQIFCRWSISRVSNCIQISQLWDHSAISYLAVICTINWTFFFSFNLRTYFTKLFYNTLKKSKVMCDFFFSVNCSIVMNFFLAQQPVGGVREGIRKASAHNSLRPQPV